MKITTIAVAATFGLASAASAQNMKPGLWEVANDVKGGGMETVQAQMAQHMANMTPEQKKMMQDMMAKQGMQMGTSSGGGVTMKTCVTKEMAARNELPAQQGDCRTTRQERTGNTVKFAMTCANPPSTGEGVVTLTSPEAFTMKMSVRSKAGGKPQTIDMEGKGKWLSADCGSVKPAPSAAGRK